MKQKKTKSPSFSNDKQNKNMGERNERERTDGGGAEVMRRQDPETMFDRRRKLFLFSSVSFSAFCVSFLLFLFFLFFEFDLWFEF
jgi:hypothetical protein